MAEVTVCFFTGAVFFDTIAGLSPENSLRQVCWSFVTFRRPFDWRSLAVWRPAAAECSRVDGASSRPMASLELTLHAVDAALVPLVVV